MLSLAISLEFYAPKLKYGPLIVPLTAEDRATVIAIQVSNSGSTGNPLGGVESANRRSASRVGAERPAEHSTRSVERVAFPEWH